MATASLTFTADVPSLPMTMLTISPGTVWFSGSKGSVCDHLKLLAQSLSVFGIRYDPTVPFLLMMRLTCHLIVLSIFYFLEAHQDLATDRGEPGSDC